MKQGYRTTAVVWIVALSLLVPMPVLAQQPPEDAAAQKSHVYSQEELDRLLAPIALYPDTLLSQILMAATYPLEVVEADRWLKQNKGLGVDALDAAMMSKPWDVSVKSLCHYPQVLAMMSDKLELTNDLGNAFLNQQEQVMNTVQDLRAKAQSRGNLTATEKQKVASEDGAITIVPATPEVVYVPAYDPCWVYGPWWYPSCTPWWFWYPGIVVGAGFFFGPPCFVGPLDFWCGFRWRRHEIFVSVNKTFVVHNPSFTRMHGGTEVWVHDPAHRRGVAYTRPETARRFGQMVRPGVDARRSFRGFAPEGIRPGTPAGSAARPFSPSPGIGKPGRPFSQPQGVSPAFRPSSPQAGHAFEGFGASHGEVVQHSERGHSSVGSSGGGRVGGGSIGGHVGGGHVGGGRR